jgi:SPP1 family predicted phage head-tail adaptor
MQAGLLRQRIELQAPEESQDTYNQPIRQFVTVATVWASVRPLVGNAFLEAQAVGAQVTHKINLRYRSDLAIQPTWRVKFGSRILELTAPPINVDERGRELVLMCREVIQP